MIPHGGCGEADAGVAGPTDPMIAAAIPTSAALQRMCTLVAAFAVESRPRVRRLRRVTVGAYLIAAVMSAFIAAS